MRVLAVIGSPHKGGNTDTLVERILEGARERGAETEKIYLSDLDLKFCRGCGACNVTKPWRGCVQKDDMIKVHEAMARADAFVVGTPIYFFGPSAQTKVFLDRWMALICSGEGGARHVLGGKRMAVAISYGEVEPFAAGAANAWGTFRDATHYMGVELVGWVHASAGKGGAAQNTEVLERSLKLGHKLCPVSTPG